jgi:hypothetical protein
MTKETTDETMARLGLAEEERDWLTLHETLHDVVRKLRAKQRATTFLINEILKNQQS